MQRTFLTSIALGLTLSGQVAGQDADRLQLHVVPTTLKSCRLLAMSRDDDGFIWAGSIHQAIHRYDPRTGDVVTVPLPVKATASSCICVGKKVYVLGQSHPHLLVLDRTTWQFHAYNYPSPKPDVWFGTQAVGGRYIYMFDRGSAGVIKWDTQTDTGRPIPYPYPGPLPSWGHYESGDQAVWCKVWDYAGGRYLPVGIARLDEATDRFTGWYPFPQGDDKLKPYTDPKAIFFLPYTLRGMLVPFDFKEKRWCSFVKVPWFGELFGFIGLPVSHRERWYFPLSTFNGSEVGCDGRPYHFCNYILEFDPRDRRLSFPTLAARDAYHQVAYMLSTGDAFFATGSNIRERDGSLKQDRAGEIVFWQTMAPVKK